MPFDIRKAGDEYKVINTDTNRVLGTHPSRKKAEAQLAALHANKADKK